MEKTDSSISVYMVSQKNGILYREDGSNRIADNAIVALTLMIAESRPEEKDMMVKNSGKPYQPS
ncbi:hypothetical protein [Mucilaginibacter inviolabilis]|uniref:hypothetical protein n=1 Tax=Mucilaginibacter inviolabilis TaxID=2714892 RepID=UPI0019346338|nr:hypothetical protein [Mucilaginibacter inviolabilis]